MDNKKEESPQVDRHQETWWYDSTEQNERGREISGMINSFADMTKYGGSFQEDLEETIAAFETIVELC